MGYFRIWILAFVLLGGIANAETHTANRGRRPADESSGASQTGPDTERPWWSPENQRYSIGYEGAGVPSVLGTNVINFGYWIADNVALDIYLGVNKPPSTYNNATNVNSDSILNTQRTTTTDAGLNQAMAFTIGAGLRYRLFQNSWFQFNVGGLIAFTPGTSTSTPTGSTSVNIPNTTAPTTFTTTQTNVGTIDVKNGSTIAVGPKLGAEFYLKWFPHLALGMSTGILATLVGDQTTTTSTASQTINTVTGTPQPPANHPSVNNTSVTKPGTGFNTFGIGGTQFNFIGTFTIRYVW